ncbi:MAG: hypothetical protein ACLFPS_01910 [Clostridia bacterium]
MKIAKIISLVIAIILILQFFLISDTINSYGNTITSWNIVIAAFAMGLAAINLIRIHVKRIQLKRPNWVNSLVLIVVLIAQAGVGLFLGDSSAQYDFFFNGILNPLGSTMYALIAFWIASAAFRAFRARTIDSTALLAVGVIVMLGNAPIGEVIWDQFPVMQDWLMNVPAMAAIRSLYIGAAIGGIAVGVRVLSGIESGHLGKSE